jgi:hypothetical protein
MPTLGTGFATAGEVFDAGHGAGEAVALALKAPLGRSAGAVPHAATIAARAATTPLLMPT